MMTGPVGKWCCDMAYARAKPTGCGSSLTQGLLIPADGLSMPESEWIEWISSKRNHVECGSVPG
jgi:hypothetical protein